MLFLNDIGHLLLKENNNNADFLNENLHRINILPFFEKLF